MKSAPIPEDDSRRGRRLRPTSVLDTPHDERFDRITHIAVRLFRVPIALVSLVEGDRQWPKSCVGMDLNEMPRSVSFCGHTIAGNAPLLVPDTLVDPRFADDPLVTGEPYVRSYAGVPLETEGGLPAGTLCVMGREPRQFSPEDLKELEYLGGWATAELRNATLERTRELERELTEFLDLSPELLCTISLDGKLLSANDSWSRQLGWNVDELQGRPFIETVHTDDVERTGNALRELRQGERLVAFVNRLVRTDGSSNWTEWTAVCSAETGLIFAMGRDLSSRDEAERALAESEERLRAVLDTSVDGIITVSEDGIIKSFNRGAEDLLGYSAEEVVGRSVNTLLPQALRSGSSEIPSYLRTGGVPVRELLGLRRDGTEVPVELAVSRFVLGGELTYTGIVRDITARKRAEREIIEHAEQMRALVEASPIGIFVTDETRLIRDANPAMLRMLGVERDELIGAGLSKYWMPGYEQATQGSRDRVIGPGAEEAFQYERCLRRTDGAAVWVKITASGIRESDGQARRVIRMVEDITAAKQAAADNHLIYGTAMAAGTTTSFEEALASCLDMVCEYVGWPLGHVYVPSEDDRRLLVPGEVWHVEELARFRAFQEATRRTVFTLGEGLPGRVWVTGNPERTMSIADDQSVVRNRTAGEAGVHGAFAFPVTIGAETVAILEFFTTERVEVDQHVLDVMAVVGSQFGRLFEREKARQELAEAYEELKELGSLKDTFLSTVSHELRTPLTSIRGALGLVGSGRVLMGSQEANHLLDIASRNSKRLADLVDDILDVQRISAKRLSFTPESVSAEALVDGVVEALESFAEQGQIRLVSSSAEGNVWGDASRLNQVLTNLVGNAIKFSPEGSTVSLRAAPRDEEVEFQVEDQGRGIPAHALRNIFDRFSQVDADRNNQRGTGLGLWISKSIVELHGGRIWVDSEPGKGSTFHFTIPSHQKDERL